MTDLPIVCTLTPAALHARREGMLAKLLEHAQIMRHSRMATGYGLPRQRIRFPLSRAPWMQNASAVGSCALASRSNRMTARFP